MADPIIPLLGAKGTYAAAAPFSTLLNTAQEYTCIGIRSISDFVVNNEDPLSLIYAKATSDTSAANTMYSKGIKDNVVVLTLQSTHGFIVYIPADYLISYPNLNGVPYVKKGIAIQLPAMSDNVDYTAFVDGLKEYIKGALGVADVYILMSNVSQPVAVTADEDEAIQASRRVAAASKGSLLLQLNRLQAEFDIVKAQRDALEQALQ